MRRIYTHSAIKPIGLQKINSQIKARASGDAEYTCAAGTARRPLCKLIENARADYTRLEDVTYDETTSVAPKMGHKHMHICVNCKLACPMADVRPVASEDRDMIQITPP